MTPKELLERCRGCGASEDWIERYQSITNYNTFHIEFNEDGGVDTFDETVGKPNWDTAETIELRCNECQLELTREQEDAVEAMYE